MKTKSATCTICSTEFTYQTNGGKPRKFCDEHRGYHCPEYRRHYHLKKEYGISEEGYNHMLQAQGGRCAICLTADPKHYGKFNVDHDHVTGKVRGLLCAQCNQAIGKFQDNIAYLEAAVLYLRKHSE